MSLVHMTTNNHNNAKTMLDLNKLVNLALNSPRVGIVNFNILKTFLLELLKALNLQHYEPKFGDDAESKHLLQYLIKVNEEGDGDQHDASHLLGDTMNENDTTGYGSEINVNVSINDGAGAGGVGGPSAKSRLFETKPVNERFLGLEDKIARLESQINALNSFPTNAAVIEKARESKKSNSSSGPILEIWQYTQLSKRLESTEDGLTKLTSLLQDLIGDINELKDGQNKNASEIKQLNESYNSLLDRFKHLEKLKDNYLTKEDLKDLERELDLLRDGLKHVDKFDEKLRILQNQVRALEAKIAGLLSASDLVDYVTWPSLENSLKGLRDMLDNNMNSRKVSTPVIPPTTVHATQTTPTPQPISRPASSIHPSAQLHEILMKLGTLNERHEDLKDLVEKLQKELADKLARPASGKKPEVVIQQQQIKLPDDFASSIGEIMKIRADLDELRQNFNQESGKRNQLENLLSNLNNEIDKLKQTLKECLESTRLNRDDIKALQEAIRILDQTKADKDWVKHEFDKKADKRDLDNKVQRKEFEDTCNDLSNNLNNCLQKTSTLEDDMKKENEKISKELDCKLDRLELDPLKEYIEKQLKKIKRIQREAQESYIKPEDEAAGLRKQLLRFHCISCDRPIDATPHPPFPSLPNERGMRPIQSPRPFTTYELDQIRQFQKQNIGAKYSVAFERATLERHLARLKSIEYEHFSDYTWKKRLEEEYTTLYSAWSKHSKFKQHLHETGYDLFSTVRQCGGSHTLTLPHKKIIKVPPQVAEEPAVAPQPQVLATPSYRPEVQIQGQDGHIYKDGKSNFASQLVDYLKNDNDDNEPDDALVWEAIDLFEDGCDEVTMLLEQHEQTTVTTFVDSEVSLCICGSECSCPCERVKNKKGSLASHDDSLTCIENECMCSCEHRNGN